MTVKVARNLHKKQYSIRENGKVTGYAESLTLRNCHFEVNEKTRLRVVQSGQKEVHAFVVGEKVTTQTTTPAQTPAGGTLIGYNPRKAGHFFRKDTLKPIHKAREVHFTPQGVYAVDPE